MYPSRSLSEDRTPKSPTSRLRRHCVEQWSPSKSRAGELNKQCLKSWIARHTKEGSSTAESLLTTGPLFNGSLFVPMLVTRNNETLKTSKNCKRIQLNSCFESVWHHGSSSPARTEAQANSRSKLPARSADKATDSTRCIQRVPNGFFMLHVLKRCPMDRTRMQLVDPLKDVRWGEDSLFWGGNIHFVFGNHTFGQLQLCLVWRSFVLFEA